MKLADHYTKGSIYISLILLLAGAIVYFFAINFVATRQLDRTLKIQYGDAQEFLSTATCDPQLYDLDKDHALFFPVEKLPLTSRFYDTLYFNPATKLTEPARAMEAGLKSGLKNYKVIIIISRAGNMYFIKVISLVTLMLLIALTGVLFLTNRYLLKDLWAPFYSTLQEVKVFNIADVPQFTKHESRVNEFNELNQAIFEMSLRVKNDYLDLKQLSENASHELMTPLAVVVSKLDTLIQDENLTSAQLHQIRDIYTSVKRSTRLNRSLLLLTKLENNLFGADGETELSHILRLKLEQFQDLIATAQLIVTHQIETTTVPANSYLLEILISNLFTNAIRHNRPNGRIDINLSNDQLVFKNTGAERPLAAASIFQRFQKSKDSQGTGLGLTLVKYICQHYQYDLQYHFENRHHVFIVTFR